jgi:ribosomal protein S6
VLVNFKSEPTFPLELERVLGITEGVIRYMTLAKVEKVAPEAPAAEEVAVEETTEA